jgi:hypothetical protein
MQLAGRIFREMEYRKHFSITLFSNASQKTYPGNTLSEFTIHLAQHIDLGSTDSWEVGLCEFSCLISVTETVDVIGTTNSLVYCNLITQQFVGSQ